MAKVSSPLGGSDARGQFGKRMVFRRGGVVTRYHVPHDPKTPAQLAQRQAFKELIMSYLTEVQARLLFSLLDHLHEGIYAESNHAHDHGLLSGLGDDDHLQYHNDVRGDARYSLLSHLHSGLVTGGDAHQHRSASPVLLHGLGLRVPAGSSRWLHPFEGGGLSTVYRRFFALVPGQVQNLFVSTQDAQPSTGTLVFTVEIEGSLTVVSKTVAASAAAGVYSNITDVINYNAGDRIILKVENNASTDSAQVTACGYQLGEGTTVVL